jgi:hypothetical protein
MDMIFLAMLAERLGWPALELRSGPESVGLLRTEALFAGGGGQIRHQRGRTGYYYWVGFPGLVTARAASPLVPGRLLVRKLASSSTTNGSIVLARLVLVLRCGRGILPNNGLPQGSSLDPQEL